ncbi:hypothetical protein Ga0080559_TMP2382 [Salipiger profundus]|uniref:Uncharacterized protein n=1 Tax=Salipiger profundus TaxID=1229727 RepID=A0A1U7D501_9RHOB|nr:hypothetical protein Ga0080559_TMP2382 [Salipiger profundus]
MQNAVEAIPQRTHREVASFLGIRASTLSYGMDPSEDRPGGLGIAYVDRLCDRWPEAAAHLAQHFAARAGGLFQPNATTAAPKAAWQHVATMAKETGEAVAALSSVEHGADRAEVRRELIEARDAIDAALRDHDAEQRAIPLRGAVK